MNLLKKSLRWLHPLLKPLTQWYLSFPHTYTFELIRIKIFPGVFHPGLFFSTHGLLEWLKNQPLTGERVLELGAGTGLISLYCHRKGAIVTASDINPQALANVKENATRNHAKITIIKSDLFQNLQPTDFDLILINPPYYPKKANTSAEMAWYCGQDFAYFKALFEQLKGLDARTKVVIIFSEDCDIIRIRQLADNCGLMLCQVSAHQTLLERSDIFYILPPYSPLVYKKKLHHQEKISTPTATNAPASAASSLRP